MSQILLVEDDPLAQEIVSSILEMQGLTVDMANDGFAALHMLRENAYEVALVDYHLPEMDGYALAKGIRDISSGRDIPLRLVGVTADRHGLAARCGADGIFDAILAKPFDPHELIGLLKGNFQLGTPRRSVAGKAEALFANPYFRGVLDKATSFWQARGLQGLPKAAILPEPSADQAQEIQICFEVVDQASAELLLILDARGLQGLVRSRLDSPLSPLPLVTLDPSLTPVSDAYFSVADPASWSAVARLLRRSA